MAMANLRAFSNAVRRRDQDAGDIVDPMMKPAAMLGEDKLGAYPTQVRVPVLEGRRYLWTTRAFALGFYASSILNIVLALLIYSMLPLKRIEPFLVTFNDKDQQVVRVEPFVKDTSGFYLMTEKLAGEYVKMREEIVPDSQEMYRRWGDYLRNYTEEEMYKTFIASIEQPLQELKAKGFSRTVNVTRVERRNDGYAEVYFTTIDFNARGEEVLRYQYIAQINYTYLQKNIRNDEKYINPLGFTVVGYNLKQN